MSQRSLRTARKYIARTPRLLISTVTLTAVLSSAACGSSEGPSVGSPTASASPTTAGELNADDATVKPESVDVQDPSMSEAPEVVAQLFAESALNNVDILTSPSIATSIEYVSPFLTDSAEQALLAADEQTAWYFLPFHVPGAFDGGTPLSASAVTRSATVVGSNSTHTQVDVIVDFIWTYDNVGDVQGTRTYTLYMIPSPDPGGFEWEIDNGRTSNNGFSD